MLGLRSTGRSRRAFGALLVTALSLGSVAMLATAAGAVPPIEAPPNADVSINFTTPTDGLVGGDSVAFTATANAPGGPRLVGLEAKLCQTGFTTYSSTTFGYNNATGNRCVKQFAPNGISSGGLTPLNGTTYRFDPIPLGGSTTGSGNLAAATGTVEWFNATGQGPFTLTCDATNPCDLVVKADIDQAPNTIYYIQTLTYAGAPGAPTGVVATPGPSNVGLSWTAPVDTGNSTIDYYTVTATGPGCAANCVVQTPNGTTTTANVSGLTPFQSYDFTVTAHNVDNFTSVASAPPVSATPAPAGPTAVTGSPANNSVALSWSYSGSPVGLSEFRITPYIAGVPQPGLVVSTGTPVTNFTVPGLSNGTVYTFTVAARYGAGEFTAESAPSGPITPNGKFITQTINVTRPNGDLVLTQVCAGSDIYPDDLNTVVYPTNCSVSLGTAKLIKTGPGAGQYFRATGALNQVTVVDTRDADPGWTVTGLTSQFVDGAKNFSCNDLGWVPSSTDTAAFVSPDGAYDQVATAGAAVAPATLAPNGLCNAHTFASANASAGLGIAQLDAALELWIPIFKPAGNYSSVMTITAV